MDLVQAVFVLIQQHQHARSAVDDLAHNSEPIDPPATVTSTALPRTQRVQEVRQRRDRVAPQQVFDRDVARIRDGLSLDQIGEIRDQSHMNRERFQEFDDPFALRRPRSMARATNTSRACVSSATPASTAAR